MSTNINVFIKNRFETVLNFLKFDKTMRFPVKRGMTDKTSKED